MYIFTKETLEQLDSAISALCRISERIHLAEESKQTTQTDSCIVLPFPDRFRATVEEEQSTVVLSQQGDFQQLFTEKEIATMPRKFRKIFRTNKQTAHIRRKDGDVYEIRMQIDGHRITASAKYLDTAKERFIKKLRQYNACAINEKSHPQQGAALSLKKLSVAEYTLHYLETFKKPNVSEKHYDNLCRIVNRHIAPFFTDVSMQSITASQCQKLLNQLSADGKGRTVEEVKNILSWICSAAVADNILSADVMAHVQTIPHRRTIGKAIPREHVRAFLEQTPQSKAELCLWLLIYTGMRPCELSTLVFDEQGFVSIQTAKKKKWEQPETRRIPLHPALSPYLEQIRAALPIALVLLERAFHKHFPTGYRLYDLRHTFTTIAQQSHCYKAWVDYVTGHKANRNTTDRVYTHWEDEWQRAEMAKIEF